MKKEFIEMIEDSKKSLQKIEKRIEEHTEDFSDEVRELWIDLKKHLSIVEDKLKDAYDYFEDQAEQKGHLIIMEARDRVSKLEETTHELTDKVLTNTQEELDIAKLKAHLLEMDNKDLWEEKQKELSALYENSKEESEKLAIKAAKELNHIFLKLTEII